MLRLLWLDDAFFALALYRMKAAMQRRGVPALPRLAHRLAMITGQVVIGDPVVIHPGVFLLHGQVVIDGVVEIHPGVVIGPFVTIGLMPGDIAGPTIGADARIGTGAKVLGRVHVGAGSSVGANGRRRRRSPRHHGRRGSARRRRNRALLAFAAQGR